MAEPALRGTLGLGEFERLSFEPGVAGATLHRLRRAPRRSAVDGRQWARPRGASTAATDRAKDDRRRRRDRSGHHDPQWRASLSQPRRRRRHVCRRDVRVHRAGRRTYGRHGHHLGQPGDAINGEFRIADRPDVTPRRSGRGQSLGADGWIDRRMAAGRRIRSRADLARDRRFSRAAAPAARPRRATAARVLRGDRSRDPAQALAPSAGRRSAPARARSSRRHAPRVSHRAVRRWPIAIASVSVSRRLASGCVVCPRITSR